MTAEKVIFLMTGCFKVSLSGFVYLQKIVGKIFSNDYIIIIQRTNITECKIIWFVTSKYGLLSIAKYIHILLLKILQSVDLHIYYQDVWDKTINLVIPSYLNSTSTSSEGTSTASAASSETYNSIEKFLRDVLIDTVKKGKKEDVSCHRLSGI